MTLSGKRSTFRILASACFTLALFLVSVSARADVITIDGTVKSVDAKKRTITVETGSKTLTLDVSSKAKISVDGKTDSLNSLKPGQKVNLSYHDKLEVVLRIERISNPDEIDLFDGKTLKGWKGDTRYWKVENGILVGTCPNDIGLGGSFLATATKYTNFAVTFQYRVVYGNSGFFVRCRTGTGSFQKYDGLQADLGPGITGILSCFNGPTSSPAVAQPDPVQLSKVKSRWIGDGWNEYSIRCNGNDVAVAVNGVTIMSWNDRRLAREGHIAVHLHGKQATKILVRRITLEKLP